MDLKFVIFLSISYAISIVATAVAVVCMTKGHNVFSRRGRWEFRRAHPKKFENVQYIYSFLLIYSFITAAFLFMAIV